MTIEERTRSIPDIDVNKIEILCDADEECGREIERIMDSFVKEVQDEDTSDESDGNDSEEGVPSLNNRISKLESTRRNALETYEAFLSIQKNHLPQEPSVEEVVPPVLTSLSELLSIQNSFQGYNVQQLETLVHNSKEELEGIPTNDVSSLVPTAEAGSFSCEDTTPIPYGYDHDTKQQQQKYISLEDKYEQSSLYHVMYSIRDELVLRLGNNTDLSSTFLLTDRSYAVLKERISSTDYSASSSCMDASVVLALYQIAEEASKRNLDVVSILSRSLLHFKEHASLDSFPFPHGETSNATLHATTSPIHTMNLYAMISSMIDSPLTKNTLYQLDVVADILGGYNTILDYIIDTLSDTVEHEDDGTGMSKNALKKLSHVLNWLDGRKEWNVRLGAAGVLRTELIHVLSNGWTAFSIV